MEKVGKEGWCPICKQGVILSYGSTIYVFFLCPGNNKDQSIVNCYFNAVSVVASDDQSIVNLFKRPFLDDFLGFFFERFDVAIWSSRTRYYIVSKLNIFYHSMSPIMRCEHFVTHEIMHRKILDPVINYLLGDLKKTLVFIWDISHCTNSSARSLENYHKFIVFKMDCYNFCLWRNGAISFDDLAGQITLEKNGKVLDFFPREVSTDHITALQVCYKPLAFQFQHILGMLGSVFCI
ncbi:putative FCP1 domain, HAD superfamily protein [Helianthus annuus]|nr:putative FCP1 domain, HAD superfamily protein [Helianthus annuus]KAJ0670308.1 putative FCP1 domain, HAD superfamily protein [Helianthus annuus]KAJ0848164.1 putative FCP1 domain, HAD-like superfamily protein [Helianthus annuus]